MNVAYAIGASAGLRTGEVFGLTEDPWDLPSGGAQEGRARATWARMYEATRHTFASQWVKAGRPIEKLKEILGHCSVLVTERYTHLRPDFFSAEDRGAFTVKLR